MSIASLPELPVRYPSRVGRGQGLGAAVSSERVVVCPDCREPSTASLSGRSSEAAAVSRCARPAPSRTESGCGAHSPGSSSRHAPSERIYPVLTPANAGVSVHSGYEDADDPGPGSSGLSHGGVLAASSSECPGTRGRLCARELMLKVLKAGGKRPY